MRMRRGVRHRRMTGIAKAGGSSDTNPGGPIREGRVGMCPGSPYPYKDNGGCGRYYKHGGGT